MHIIRAFVAVKIADSVKENILSAVKPLKSAGADVKWVAAENIHLTLKFLGGVSRASISELSKFLAEDAKAIAPFEMSVGGLGVFPPKGEPRVIWAGCCNEEILKKLAFPISASAEKIGVAKEDKPFSAHITIGRVKSPKNIELIKPLIAGLASGSFGVQLVNSFELLESKLQSSGPIYTVLESYPIG